MEIKTPTDGCFDCVLERVRGIEPRPTVWKTAVLPLYDTRNIVLLYQILYGFYNFKLKELGYKKSPINLEDFSFSTANR